MKSCIITSASNKFFPSLLNLIGSIKAHYPNHPPIFVYDLGLFSSFRKEIASIPNIQVIDIPHFVSFWRSCYTWKSYIFKNPLAELNLYLDAGGQVLRPLDDLFAEIDSNGYLAIGQGKNVPMINHTPEEYISLFEIDNETLQKEVITAGIFGFKSGREIEKVTHALYDAGIAGLCLGFSKKEQWKNKGVNKNNFIRNCPAFRHDTTLLSLFLRKYIKNLHVQDVAGFSAERTSDTQFIWNMRLNYQNLEHLKPRHLVNKIFVFFFLFFKSISNRIKKSS